MKLLSAVVSLSVGFLLLMCASYAFAGDPCATFGYRLTCPYSSFVEASVISVCDDTVSAQITASLLRAPDADTVEFRNHDYGYRLRPGDLVLINYWSKPEKIDYTLFPNSFHWGVHYMGRITDQGKSVDVPHNWTGFSEIVNWLYSTGKWDVSLVYRRGRMYAVEKTGLEHLVYDEEELRSRMTSQQASPARSKNTYPYAVVGAAVLVVLVAGAYLALRRRRA